MKPLSTDDLRQAYLDFFADHGHSVIPSAPLVPENDPTVLFTTAGMHPLVPYLLGEPHPRGRRLTDVQRSVRTQDIDEVGDASHLTFFEMLGNWSLGDYFKEEAIAMSFSFLTEVLEIPLARLAVTCFGGDKRFPALPRDEEAAAIWRKHGIPVERIAFMEGGVLESKQNWWGPAGLTGPCGPDTEMFVWMGEGVPRGNPATNEADWLEIWNDVFMQYNKTANGTFEPLKQKNVDTGMGLERAAAVLQRVSNVYETDRMAPILRSVESLAGTITKEGQRSKDTTRHTRIIVDHLRAAAFIIADGISPSNVDQGYVLRRIIRRAIRSARRLGIEHAGTFAPAVAEAVIGEYGHVWGHLMDRKTVILESLAREEQQFSKTLAEGLKHFDRVLKGLPGKTIDGMSAFHLYDTYGFPLELTVEMAQEYGCGVDEAGFKRAFEEHQSLSRAGAEKRFSGGLADHSAQTTKLHTATHLLNASLKKVLGEHVNQRGSNITAERLRFDFNHGEKLTGEQLKEVERLVNEAIEADLPITYHITSVEKAKEKGAVGVFDARYDAEVKVYTVGDLAKGTVFSKEICGGPHVASTGMLGTFKILKEESSSAGIRRIKATLSGGPADIAAATLAE
ncbi:alanine--tRNA ligase [Candidatus Peribacteria bacterium RIFOXYC2_FULL_58_10]|nr:MAG: alanine--tRNA ligase [Candidatus Peribacteria bacterium RIFOXYC2_FULL_58_10]HAS34033.1 alanine--tRNA ligase [Candidatus Peribacteria bacterium]